MEFKRWEAPLELKSCNQSISMNLQDPLDPVSPISWKVCESPIEMYLPYLEEEIIFQEKNNHLNEFYKACDYFAGLLPSNVQQESMFLWDEQISESQPAAVAHEALKAIFNKPVKKAIQKQGSRFYNKNICRYIFTQALKQIRLQLPIVSQVCEEFNVDVDEFVKHHNSLLTKVLGPQMLKKTLRIDTNENHKSQQMKLAFQKFMVWYLDNMATRQILRSKNKTDKREYLRYKNYIMTYIVLCPNSKFTGNQLPDWVELD